MKHLFTTFYKSFTDPTIYRTIVQQKFRKSLGYFAFFYFLISIGISIFLTIFTIPKIYTQLLGALSDLKTQFPQEAVIEIKPDQLTLSNSLSPLTIPSSDGSLPKNILTIDTSVNAESIKDKQTLILLTHKAIAMASDTNISSFQVLSYDQLGLDTKIDYQTVVEQTDALVNMLSQIKPYIFLLILIPTFTFLVLNQFINVIIYSLFLNLVGLILTRPYGYSNFLKISLHTVVIAEIISLITRLIYGSTFVSLFTIAYFGISFLSILSLPRLIRIQIKSN